MHSWNRPAGDQLELKPGRHPALDGGTRHLSVALGSMAVADAHQRTHTPLTVMRTAMDVVLAKPEPTRGELVSMVAEDALEGRTASGISTTARLGEAPVTGDGVLLERLVANLLDNAERYNIPGGTVCISTTTQNGASLVQVVNTGPAVPPGQVDRLFLPFTRLDDRTRHDGFGLGLALVSSIAAVRGGTVHATAGAAGGLDITVRLPRRGDAVTPAPPAT